MSEKESQTSTSVAGLKKLGNDILTDKYEGPFSSWVYDNPAEIQAREKEIDSMWANLTTLSDEKRRVLDDHLARETYAAETRVLNRGHVDKFDKLMAWVAEKEEYLNKKEEIDSVSEAQTHKSLLEAYRVENEAMTQSSLASLKELGAVIHARKYESKYSSYTFETPDEITTREAQVDGKWVDLSHECDAKAVVLEEDLKRELEKERLRLLFAAKAGSMSRWAKEAADKAKATQFGFTLEEVQSFKATLDTEDSHLDSEGKKKCEEGKQVHQDGVAMGVRENIYTKSTPADLDAATASVAAATAERRQAYDVELKHQIANDNLCKEFAAAADPFAKALSDEKDRITHAKDTLEQQLQYVIGKIQGMGGRRAELAKIQEASAKMDQAGITNNRHTTLTAKDVEVLLEQFGLFLEKKKVMLENEIEHEKLRGLTADQMKEIDENFLKFDVNGDGVISKKELKAVLYSIGEERSVFCFCFIFLFISVSKLN